MTRSATLHPLHALEVLPVRQERVLREDPETYLVGTGGRRHHIHRVAGGAVLGLDHLEFVHLVDVQVAVDVVLREPSSQLRRTCFFQAAISRASLKSSSFTWAARAACGA